MTTVASLKENNAISPETAFFRRQQTLFQDVEGATLAYRKIGDGPPLILLHGWPFSGLTFRKLVPYLSKRFTCYVPDIPGAGDSRWYNDADFRFTAQAGRVRTFIDRVGIDSYSLLAYDTGGTLARMLALADRARVRKVVLLNTEIPGHRPPWIPLYGSLLAAPFTAHAFGVLLRSRTFVRSSLGFGGCFADSTLLNDDFAACVIGPLVHSARRREGMRRYLRGFEWSLVDAFAKQHRAITAPVLMIWGEDDPTFPIDALLVHEEQPEAVSSEALSFLDSA